MNRTHGLAGRIAHAFIDSRLTPLIVVGSLLLGAFAVLRLPREEEPQIIVPMIDVMVQAPGMSAKEVEQRVTAPMEKLLWEIPGVEYVYSTSSSGMSLAVVRFYVGTDEEKAIVRTYNKLYANFDRIPPGVSQPLVKPRSIDDVPILALTFWGGGYDHLTLRRMAAEVERQLKEIPDVSETRLIGGQRRQIRVTLDAAKLGGFGLAPLAVARRLQQANQELPAGSFSRENTEFRVHTGRFLGSATEIGSVVVGTFAGRPVYLSDVAAIEDGGEEPDQYVFFAEGRASKHSGVRVFRSSGLQEGNRATPEHLNTRTTLRAVPPEHLNTFSAVTLSIAKRKGKNAIVVAGRVKAKLEALRGRLIPRDVNVTVTRNYGETAAEKSNELLFHMAIAVLSVTLLIALALGFREAGVVLVAIPVTLALTLLVFFLYGYTLNRITLFALIFSIGILVDDAIVVVENIVRHFRLPQNRGRPLAEVASEAVDEVGNPTILATFTVIAAVLPMAFVGGLMGPYMRPIPIGSSAAMLFSMLAAFVISPWAALRLLRRSHATGERRQSTPAPNPQPPTPDPHAAEGFTTRLYRRAMGALIRRARVRAAFLVGVGALLVGAVAFVPLRWVTVKMLPFDNKSEFQVIIDTDEGAPLEETARVTWEIGAYLATVPEVTHFQMYIGTASPYNFNGLVRHYYMRRGPNVADIQVNLRPKHDREAQSHEIARRVRPTIQAIAARHGAQVQIAEVPPGPPVLQTLVAEVYGPDYEQQRALAREILALFRRTEGVVDADWYMEADQPEFRFVVDTEKAALHGVGEEEVTRTLSLALSGASVGLAHLPLEKEDVPIVMRLPRAQRSGVEELRQIRVAAPSGALIPLGELVRVERVTADRSIYHKNLMPVVYVTGDVGGRAESPVYAILALNRELRKLRPAGSAVKIWNIRQPFTREKPAMKWDGEWHITLEVFRDLGLAFAAVMVLIYILVVGWFQNFKTPIVILAAIPFSLVGILPAHALLGAFFTATSMIGFIAGAGIVVRNSIILVDFIELRLRQGMPLDEAVIDAGAVRFRPMLLTAAAVVVGSAVILFDPIFQGLAIALMAGEVASLLLSRMTVPVLFFLMKRRELAAAAPEPDAQRLTLDSRPSTLLLLAMLMTLPGATARGQPPPPAYDLRTAVRTALDNHPSLRAAGARVTEARSRLRHARSSAAPRLGATLGYTELQDDPSFSVPSLGTLVFGERENEQATLVLQVPLFTGGRVESATRQARAGVDASHSALERQRQKVARDTVVGYYEVLKARGLVRTAEAELAALQAQRDAIARLQTQGLATRVDLLRAETAVSAAREGLIRARNGESVAVAALATAMGLPADPSLRVVEEETDAAPDQGGAPARRRRCARAPTKWPGTRLRVEGVRPVPESVAAAVQEALRLRPELRQVDAERRAAEAGAQVARSGQRPTLGLYVQYDATRPTTLPRTGRWSAGAAVTINVFDGGAARADVARARAQVEQAEAARAELRNAITLEVTRAFLGMQSARERVTTTERAVATAEEGARLIRLGYQSHVNTFTDVLAARAELTKAQADQVIARFDLRAAEAELQFAMGRGP